MKRSLILLALLVALPLVAQTDLPPELAKELKAAEANGGSRFFEEFLNMLFMLGLLVGLLYVGTWIFKKMATTKMVQINETSSIKVLEQRALSTKSSLYIVEVEGKKIILGESINGITLLD